MATITLGKLTIPSSGTDSNSLSFYGAEHFAIHAPNGLYAATYTIQSSPDNGTTWFTLSDGTSDIKVPAANKVIDYPHMALPLVRIHASGAVTGDQVFIVTANE